jgi:RNA recognition motif-containing protein
MNTNPTKPSQGIFVSGLPIYSCKDKLRSIFSQFGAIKFVRIFSKKQGRKNQSFAKIKFEDPMSVLAALRYSEKLKYEDRFMNISELKSQSKLEKTLHTSKNVVFVNNLPEKPRKAEIVDCLKQYGIPAKKVIRVIKKRELVREPSSTFNGCYSNLTMEGTSSFSYGCILQLEDTAGVNINALNGANVVFYGKRMGFSLYQSKQQKKQALPHDLNEADGVSNGAKKSFQKGTGTNSPVNNENPYFSFLKPQMAHGRNPFNIQKTRLNSSDFSDSHQVKPTSSSYFSAKPEFFLNHRCTNLQINRVRVQMKAAKYFNAPIYRYF